MGFFNVTQWKLYTNFTLSLASIVQGELHPGTVVFPGTKLRLNMGDQVLMIRRID